MARSKARKVHHDPVSTDEALRMALQQWKYDEELNRHLRTGQQRVFRAVMDKLDDGKREKEQLEGILRIRRDSGALPSDQKFWRRILDRKGRLRRRLLPGDWSKIHTICFGDAVPRGKYSKKFPMVPHPPIRELDTGQQEKTYFIGTRADAVRFVAKELDRDEDDVLKMVKREKKQLESPKTFGA